jgi:penicillin G amidase
LRRLGTVLVVAGAILSVLFLLLVWSTIPRRSGTLRVRGLAAPITIETDAHGVPTIRAASEADALFGLGYVHARDRLWQVEYQRRIGSGRLAEILGPRLVETDRFLRTIGFRRAAESAWRALPPEERRLLEAYTRGLNAYVASASARPIEFRILRCPVTSFEPVDGLTWAKLMAWDLAGNARAEIRRARLVEVVGEKRAQELLPPPSETLTILRDDEWSGGQSVLSASRRSRKTVPLRNRGLSPGFLARMDDLFARMGARDPDSVLGSNSWVLAGSRTTGGKPILANDPHLGLRTPSVWYLARLTAPGYSVSGGTLPGVAGVVIGTNSRIAWALTSLEPDVQDLYVEDVDPADPSRYRWRGGWRRFETRRETIRVRGRGDVSIDVRRSVHGPIVTDVLDGADSLGRAVALRWAALDDADSTAQAIEGFNRSSGWSEFLEAARLFQAPPQNLLYADADGHIGYTASGSIPIRPRSDGLLPVSGRGDDDWTGYVPFEELPRVLDPPKGYLVAANNRPVSPRYPRVIAGDWPEPYRARRISDRILAKDRLGVAEVRSIQLDRVSLQATDLLPLLLATVPADAASRDALARLATWNREFAPDSVPAAIYAAWYTMLAKMPEDELAGAPLGTVRSRFLINALSFDRAWCDDVRTPRRETCAEFRTRALGEAVSLLRRRLGEDPRGWRWERLHRARFPHGIFDTVKGLRAFFSLETGQGGDASTVNVGAYRLDGTFRMTDGPSYRQIVDFSDPGGSHFVHTTGQSGNVFDPRYRDLLPLWKAGADFRIGGTPVKLLRLVPK